MVIPRIIRLRDAPSYMGMDINRFNDEVRKSLTAIPIGTQGIGFDRLEMDAWIDNYIAGNGRPWVEDKLWDAGKTQVSSSVESSGISTSKSSVTAFEEALVRSHSQKQKGTSRGASKR